MVWILDAICLLYLFSFLGPLIYRPRFGRPRGVPEYLKNGASDAAHAFAIRVPLIKLWGTSRSRAALAPVSGVFLPTQHLTTTMTEEQLKTVILHELSHIKRQHLATRLVVGGGFLALLVAAMHEILHIPDLPSRALEFILVFAVLITGVRIIPGILYRRQERDADLDTAEYSECPGTFARAVLAIYRTNEIDPDSGKAG